MKRRDLLRHLQEHGRARGNLDFPSGRRAPGLFIHLLAVGHRREIYREL